MRLNSSSNVHLWIEKIAYGPSEHKALAGVSVPPSKGVGKSFRKAVGAGSVRVDTGITKPEMNPFTFSRAHAAPNVPKASWGKQLVQLQNEASSNLARGAISHNQGNAAAASKYLGRSAATIGRGNHTLVDRQAHTMRPKNLGFASPLRKVPNIIPGKGWATSAHEHLKGDAPNRSTMHALKQEAGKLLSGKVSSDGHKLDTITGDVADKKAIRQSRRYGSAYIGKAVRSVQEQLGVSHEEAKKIVERALQSEVDDRSVRRGQVRQDARTVAGEIKHRVKSPQRRLKSIARRLLLRK